MDTFIRELPKLELHAHIGGSAREDTILDMIKQRQQRTGDKTPCAQQDAVSIDQVTVTRQNLGKRTMKECFALFDTIHRLTDNLDSVCRITGEALEDFRSDGARYVELRSTPRAMETARTSTRDYVEAVLNRIQKFQHDSKRPLLGCGLLLSVNRSQSIEKARETVKLAAEFRDRGVCGLDFSGNCYVGPFSQFRDVFEYARREHRLPVTLHFGETLNGEDSNAILDFEPERVGHASVLADDMQERLIAKGLPIECCFTSNLMCRMHPSLMTHPFRKYHQRAKNPLTLCTDDQGVFQTSLVQEYTLLTDKDIARELLGVEYQNVHVDAWMGQLKQKVFDLSRSSIDHTFCTNDTKQRMKREWTEFARAQGLECEWRRQDQ